MLSEDDMEDWAQPTQIFYGLHSATMVDRKAVCVGGMAMNGSFVGTHDKNLHYIITYYIALDFIHVCLLWNKVTQPFTWICKDFQLNLINYHLVLVVFLS